MDKLRQVGLQGLGLLVRKASIALSFLLIARKLGPSTFGSFSYVYTWVAVFALISSLGFSPVTTREVARDPDSAPNVLKSALSIRLVASMIATALLFLVMFASPIGRPEIRGIVLLLAWTILPLAVLDQLAAHVMGFSRNSSFALINAIQWGAFFVATLLGTLIGQLAVVLSLQLAALWLSVLVCLYLFRDHFYGALRNGFNVSLARYLAREAAPLAMTNLFGVLYFRIGTLQLFHYLGAKPTGFYTSSLQVVEALQLIPMAITGAMFPFISKARDNKREFSRLFSRIVIMLVFLSLFIGATASTISTKLMLLVFGSAYATSGALLGLLIWAATPTFLHYSLAYFLIAAHKQKIVTVNAIIGVIVSFVANSILIPRYGALGAVYGTLITESSICVLHAYFVLRLVTVRAEMNRLAVPILGALAVATAGSVWHESINATVVNVVLFSIVSAVLFASAFLACTKERYEAA